MPLTLFRHRSVRVPTAAGWLALLLMMAAPILLWWVEAERFLSVTQRVPANLLVLEAWTGDEGADAAAREFRMPNAHYRYLVVVGGLTGEPWTRRRWSYPQLDCEELLRDGIPLSRIIQVECPDFVAQRTFQTALMARSALDRRGLNVEAVNVLTETVHARRSRLVYRRAFGPEVSIGIISWIPSGSEHGHWWNSSNRALDLIKETVAYPWEALFHSGRGPAFSRGARLPPAQS